MLKTSAKIFLLFILLVTVALATGFVTYTLTKRVAEENSISAVETVSAETVKPTAADKPQEQKSDTDSSLSESYIVRLEGTTLGVYVTDNGTEEFLYHTNVYKSDLSEEDLKLLQDGVRLMNLSELTGFIENFTS